MSPSKSADESTVPVLKNLTIENITENVHRINSQCSDPRLKYVMERLVTHLHDFARETRLSFDEWMAGIQFLTQVGQICTDVRQVRTPFLLSLLRKNPQANNKKTKGIHSPLRHCRSLPPRRLNRSPKTPFLNRRHGPWSLPHARRPFLCTRRQNLGRPLWHTSACPLHRKNHIRGPNIRRQNRRLGNGFQRQVRRAI